MKDLDYELFKISEKYKVIHHIISDDESKIISNFEYKHRNYIQKLCLPLFLDNDFKLNEIEINFKDITGKSQIFFCNKKDFNEELFINWLVNTHKNIIENKYIYPIYPIYNVSYTDEIKTSGYKFFISTVDMPFINNRIHVCESEFKYYFLFPYLIINSK